MIQGKIFDNTPSGITLKNRRDRAMEICVNNKHTLGDYVHKKTDNENSLTWTCTKCGQTLIMDFVNGEEKGSAMRFPCRGKSWL